MGILGGRFLFFQQFFAAFSTTGSIWPSSRFLTRAITRKAAERRRPAQFLEVGPGTGVFTDQLICLLETGDRLTIVEINPVFVQHLRQQLDQNPLWKAKREQVDLIEGSAENLPGTVLFDAIVCGLPFNNFPPDFVSRLMGGFLERLAPGGTLSYFEYWGIRPLKRLVSSRTERERIDAVGQTLSGFLARCDCTCDRVLANFPPALAQHLSKPTV